MPEPIHTLGIDAAFRDRAACIMRDGVVIAAVESESFTHVKHAKRPAPFFMRELPCHVLGRCAAAWAAITAAFCMKRLCGALHFQVFFL
ncbi:hypothetical protein [Burkholderia anthina]|uniref:hypothetical protein n=1 Tax=Burkholderia anthina TaxID=179879 RepID=UPI00158EA5C9|nr:hypothetical protein [Burkholderia anthina]